jgi:predicted component of type VI protein secretion system
MTNTEIAPLNSLERTNLRNAEATIDKGKVKFLEVGNALKVIQDEKLYRETHRSFQAYVEDRHNFKRAWAYRLIQHVTVAKNLSSTLDTSPPELPSRQVEALAKLPAEQQGAAYKDADEKDGNTAGPSASDVEEVVDRYLADNEPYVEPPEDDGDAEAPEPTDTERDKAQATARKALGQLKRAFDTLGIFEDHRSIFTKLQKVVA